MTRSARKAKSSPAARRLIRAALARHKTQRAAARALGLPNHGQLGKLLAGTIHDTPAMRAALARADARAKRAWALVRPEANPALDAGLIADAIERIECELAALKSLVRDTSTREKGS